MTSTTICISDQDAQMRFSELLERVVDGEEITITRHGMAVAKLVPVTTSQLSRQEAIRQMRELAQRNRLDGLRITDLVAEGRK